ncbi:transglycosylase domain-containing protein [Bacteroides sp. OttesenSCG-928-D19]|nr:transglycosylase domain-containing protein [Bacteroides sp. OttesenSCG-928-D19]
MEQTKKKKRGVKLSPKNRKRINIALWSCFLLALLMVGITFAAISKGHIGYMPSIDQLENPIDRYASQVISEDGVMLGVYSSSKDNRLFVKYSDLSPELVQALIATEDNRFVKHSGIDAIGLMRAIVKRGILMQKSGGGGSTISQQLAKQLFSPRAGSMTERVLQKPIEWVIAIRLEKYYTKEEIINMYLNKFDFLYNAVGIQSASRVYFNTTPKNLKIEEAATLVGMCKNPSYYNAARFGDRAKGRRNTVLLQMNKYGYLDKAVCDSLCQLPLELNFNRIDHKEGLAPYFREYLRLTLTAPMPERSKYPSWQQQKYVEDSIAWETNPMYGWCNKNTKASGESYNIYRDGLKIYTTLNSNMQQYAEDAVREHLGKTLQPSFTKEKKGRKYAPFSFPYSMPEKDKENEINKILDRSVNQSHRYRSMKEAGAGDEEITRAFKTKTEMSVFSWDGMIDTVMTPLDSIRYYKTFLRTAFMAMDARTGHVKSYVGGIDFANFQYDMVTTGRRQIGSTMKPFVFSLAMIEGFTPCDKMLHVQQQLVDDKGVVWAPRTSTSKCVGEEVTLQWGLQNSSNWVTAYLMKKLSPYALERFLRSYGFKGHIDPVVAMCLGTPDISLAEMVSAYSVFTNKGIRIEPIYITHIEDAYGNTVATFAPQTNEVLPEDATYKMLSMLQSVVDGGSAGRMRWRHGIKAAMGGKTGTTQNQSDGWYMGFTPSLVAGCWVGGEDRSIHFDNMEGQGAHVALPVYAIFMNKVYADKELGYSEDEKFDIPEEFKDPCVSRNKKGGEGSTKSRTTGFDEFFN